MQIAVKSKISNPIVLPHNGEMAFISPGREEDVRAEVLIAHSGWLNGSLEIVAVDGKPVSHKDGMDALFPSAPAPKAEVPQPESKPEPKAEAKPEPPAPAPPAPAPKAIRPERLNRFLRPAKRVG